MAKGRGDRQIGNQNALKYSYKTLDLEQWIFVAGQLANGSAAACARIWGRKAGRRFMAKSSDEGVYIFRVG